MLLFISKTVISAVIISFCSWLSGRHSVLAGFITALPLFSMLALASSYLEWNNLDQTVLYTKSILLAIPLSLLFFVPMVFAKKLDLGFWAAYSLGIALLGMGFFIHQFILKKI